MVQFDDTATGVDVTGETSEADTERKNAIVMAFALTVLATSGRAKADMPNEERTELIYGTYTDFIEALGYTIIKKDR